MVNIDQLIREAMLSKDKVALNAYKNIKAEIQKNQTAKGAKPLTEELVLQIISKYAKNLEDAISQFSEARRDDLVSEYSSELEVVKKLLPEPVDESEIRAELYNHGLTVGWSRYEYEPGVRGGNTIVEIPKKEMGTAIKYLKSKFPTADGKMISDIVKQYVI